MNLTQNDILDRDARIDSEIAQERAWVDRLQAAIEASQLLIEHLERSKSTAAEPVRLPLADFKMPTAVVTPPGSTFVRNDRDAA